MKVKATKAMTKYLNDHIENITFTLEKLTEAAYRMQVDIDTYLNEIDYSIKTGLFSVIKVSYPGEYYAMPRYLTTKDLNRIFARSDHTAEGFIKAVLSDIEI